MWGERHKWADSSEVEVFCSVWPIVDNCSGACVISILSILLYSEYIDSDKLSWFIPDATIVSFNTQLKLISIQLTSLLW